VITKTTTGDQTGYCLVIRPNRSLTWAQTKLAVCLIGVAPLSVALGFALAGLWPVVPFAGLELLAVGLCFYHCARRAGECEIVTVREGEIVVEKGRKRAEVKWSFNRYWAAIALDDSAGSRHPSRLFIRAHAGGVEIGRFLVEQERVALAGELRKLVGRGTAASAHTIHC
jgi:uncharacterized membrane protein